MPLELEFSTDDESSLILNKIKFQTAQCVCLVPARPMYVGVEQPALY